uniref:Reverse transcriptase RNase H-like domain-containing protein n=1 Tax=Oryzias sinensis TaxID=183150 RepID=A0A8C7WS97_9TELE
MLQRLGQVFHRLKQANLKLKPSKCCLFRHQVAYLGHIVLEHGVATDPDKVCKVQAWPTPKSIHDVRRFIGLASYYRRFVKDFAAIAEPLHNLTKKNARFHWQAEHQASYETLKPRLTTAPVLGYPLDNGEMILDTDASNTGHGAILSQVQDGAERVLAYGSRKLAKTEQNYCTTRRELLAIVEFTSHSRQYLLGRPFKVRTDHSSLRWLTRMKVPESQLARWLEKLAEYDFEIIHRPGGLHTNADSLSRRPCRQFCPCNLQDCSPQPGMMNHKAIQCDIDSNSRSLSLSLVGAERGSETTPTVSPVGVSGNEKSTTDTVKQKATISAANTSETT